MTLAAYLYKRLMVERGWGRSKDPGVGRETTLVSTTHPSSGPSSDAGHAVYGSVAIGTRPALSPCDGLGLVAVCRSTWIHSVPTWIHSLPTSGPRALPCSQVVTVSGDGWAVLGVVMGWEPRGTVLRGAEGPGHAAARRRGPSDTGSALERGPCALRRRGCCAALRRRLVRLWRWHIPYNPYQRRCIEVPHCLSSPPPDEGLHNAP